MSITVSKDIEFDEDDLQEYLESMDPEEAYQFCENVFEALEPPYQNDFIINVLNDKQSRHFAIQSLSSMKEAHLVEVVKELMEDHLQDSAIRAIFEHAMNELVGRQKAELDVSADDARILSSNRPTVDITGGVIS